MSLVNKKNILLYLIFTFYGFFIFQSVSAKVSTKHTVIYTISDDLTANVKHTVNLSFEDKYSGIDKIIIEEPTKNISNLNKPLNKRGYALLNDSNKVIIKFNDLIVGPINLNLEYSYITKEIIKKVGTLYTMELPKVTGEEIESYELFIYLPKSIPLGEYSNKIKNNELGSYLYFTKKDLEDTGKFLNFGKEIYYELSVKHLISNEKNYIVIPPTIPNRQDVFIEDISELPKKVYKDADENLIFEYDKTVNTQSITATYLIRIYGNSYSEKLSDYKRYLQPIKNWDFKKGIPLEITKKIVDSNNAIERAFIMTTNMLEYNKNSISIDTNLRIGAENINENNSKNAVCLEYSDLLISLLRGIGIPAREINGLNYKNNIPFFKDPELHSWVEYYDSKNWRQVDPTFADTSEDDYFNNFDLYHIAFVRRSENSEYPLLTGSYSTNNIREQLKIITVNKPALKTVNIKYYNLFLAYFALNNSFSYINNIPPKSTMFISSKEFEPLKSYSNSFIEVKLEKANIYEVLDTQKSNLLIFASSLLFALIGFILIHKNLLNKKTRKKDKVSRIV